MNKLTKFLINWHEENVILSCRQSEGSLIFFSRREESIGMLSLVGIVFAASTKRGSTAATSLEQHRSVSRKWTFWKSFEIRRSGRLNVHIQKNRSVYSSVTDQSPREGDYTNSNLYNWFFSIFKIFVYLRYCFPCYREWIDRVSCYPSVRYCWILNVTIQRAIQCSCLFSNCVVVCNTMREREKGVERVVSVQSSWILEVVNELLYAPFISEFKNKKTHTREG